MSGLNALDTRVTMAMNVQSQPGVFAVLLGSGVSTGAGIPTGWNVVQELIARAATAAGDNTAAVQAAREDPEQWWADHHDGDALGYSNLLTALAPSSAAARRGLIKGFFEADPADAEAGEKVPTAAHRAVAALVKSGHLRVIVTTNFDRLMERALEDAHVLPQVIHSTATARGMTPLQHAPATVIKVNGDWADLEMRNTVEELTVYSPAMRSLLRRVFEEYGLIISGWSADWDLALREEIARTATRRYPLYWDSRSSRGDGARRILAARGGATVLADSADVLFDALNERVIALEKVAAPAVSTAVTIARLKRYLPDPVRRIALTDLVLDAVAPVAQAIADGPSAWSNEPGFLDELFERYRQAAAPLAEIVATGVFYDTDHQHTTAWVEVIQRLLDARSTPSGAFNRNVFELRYFPALLVLRAAGIAALKRGDDTLLLALLTRPGSEGHAGTGERTAAADLLNPMLVVDHNLSLDLARFNSQAWFYPWSVLLREDLREPLRNVVASDAEYQQLGRRFEYRMALVEWATKGGDFKFSTGEYCDNAAYRTDPPTFEDELRRDIASAGEANPWKELLGDAAQDIVEAFTQDIAKERRQF